MKAHAPESYDEITRRTVLEPDGSVRPQLPHQTSPEADARVRDAVTDALIACGFDDLGVEVAGGRVILRGWAPRLDRARLAARIARSAAPDAQIDVRIRLR